MIDSDKFCMSVSNKLDSYAYYTNINYNIVKLIHALSVKDINTIFFIIAYMLEGGYFSINGNYEYSINSSYDKNLSEKEEGEHIMLGYGCCRHEAAFLNDIYQSLGYESYNLSSRLLNNIFDFSIKVNHATVMINLKTQALIHDLTNWGVLQLLKNGKTFSYSKGIYIKMTLREKEEKKDLLISYEKLEYNKSILNLNMEEAYCILLDNSDLLSDFYEEIHPSIYMIDRLIRKKDIIVRIV